MKMKDGKIEEQRTMQSQGCQGKKLSQVERAGTGITRKSVKTRIKQLNQ